MSRVHLFLHLRINLDWLSNGRVMRLSKYSPSNPLRIRICSIANFNLQTHFTRTSVSTSQDKSRLIIQWISKREWVSAPWNPLKIRICHITGYYITEQNELPKGYEPGLRNALCWIYVLHSSNVRLMDTISWPISRCISRPITVFGQVFATVCIVSEVAVPAPL